jgi:hypothetical protein
MIYLKEYLKNADSKKIELIVWAYGKKDRL